MEIADRDALYGDAAASLHQGAARRGADPRPGARAGARAAVLGGEVPSRSEPAARLRVPHPLPDRRRGMPARSCRRCAKCGRGTSRPASRSESRSARATRTDELEEDNTMKRRSVDELALGIAAIRLGRRTRARARADAQARRHAQVRGQRRDRRTTTATRSDTFAPSSSRRRTTRRCSSSTPTNIPRSWAISPNPGRSRPTA